MCVCVCVRYANNFIAMQTIVRMVKILKLSATLLNIKIEVDCDFQNFLADVRDLDNCIRLEPFRIHGSQCFFFYSQPFPFKVNQFLRFRSIRLQCFYT